MDFNQIAFIVFLVVFIGWFIVLYIKSIFDSHGG